MATANFKIDPEDGWVKVTAAGVNFIRIRSTDNKTMPFYVTSGGADPDPTEVGYKVNCEDFWVDVTTTEAFYVRTVENQPQGCHISVFFLTS